MYICVCSYTKTMTLNVDHDCILHNMSRVMHYKIIYCIPNSKLVILNVVELSAYKQFLQIICLCILLIHEAIYLYWVTNYIIRVLY